jgi:hypothetical protein
MPTRLRLFELAGGALTIGLWVAVPHLSRDEHLWLWAGLILFWWTVIFLECFRYRRKTSMSPTLFIGCCSLIFAVAGAITGLIVLRHFPVEREAESPPLTAADIADAIRSQSPIIRGTILPAGHPLSTADQGTRETSNIPDDATLVLVGDAKFILRTLPFVMVKSGNEDTITIGKTDRGLELSAKFFDEDGNIMCQIVKNSFDVNQNKGNYSFVRQPTPSSLIVQDHHGVEVCNVQYLDRQTIRFTGEFYLSDGNRLTIGADSIVYGKTRCQLGTVNALKGGPITMLSLPAPLVGFSEQNRYRTDAAYLSFQSPISLSLSPSVDPGVEIRIKNLGDFPTKIDRFQLYLGTAFVQDAIQNVVARFHQAPIKNPVMPEIISRSVFTLQGPAIGLDDHTVSLVKAGAIYLRIICRIWYQDGRGNEASTWCCGRYDPESGNVIRDLSCKSL